MLRGLLFLTITLWLTACRAETATLTPTTVPTLVPTIAPSSTPQTVAQVPTRGFSAVGTAAATDHPFPSKTPTLMPTVTPNPNIPTLTPTSYTVIVVVPPSTVVLRNPTALVAEGSANLRLRNRPDPESQILTHLDEGMPLTIVGRTADSAWLQVNTLERETGWVLAAFLDIDGDLELVRVPGEVSEPQQRLPLNVISGISPRAREIFLRGQGMGSSPNVFSKVGDSITVATYFLYPLSWESRNLRGYQALSPVLEYFSSTMARDANSFGNTSLAANNGWTTGHVLDTRLANPQLCAQGETPLSCEYRLTRPAVSLIMLGTNDAANISPADFRVNMTRILDTTIDAGIIPVVSTIPARPGWERQINTVNDIIINMARDYDIPLWDYSGVMRTLPNMGLSADNVHPSYPPETWQAGDFTQDNVRFGYTMRNLTALQVLDAVWRQAMS